MDDHKYKVGQTVRYVRKLISGRVPDALYEVRRAMPSDGREPSYRIKASHETYERVAREDEIEAAFRS